MSLPYLTIINVQHKVFETIKLLKEHDEYDSNDIVLIKSLTYYKLEFLTNGWILKTLYISKPHIYLQLYN